MLGNILIVLSLAVSILALLDIYLDASQKERISNTSTEIWVWLSDISKLSFLDLLRERAIQLWIVSLAALSSFTGLVWFGSTDEYGGDVLLFLLQNRPTIAAAMSIFFGFLVWFGPKIIAFTVAPHNSFFILIRAIVVLISFTLVVYAATTGINVAETERNLHPMAARLDQSFTIYAVIIIFGFFFIILFFMIVVPLTFVFTARVLLTSVEVTVRRIIEYPKGPILAGSATARVSPNHLHIALGFIDT